LFLVGAAAICVVAIAVRAQTSSAVRETTKAVVFQSNRDGDDDIYTVSLAASARPVPLTKNSVPDATPTAFRGGSKIVFARGNKTGWDLYTMRADGTNQRRLTSTPKVDEFDPVPSPDGKYVAFESDANGNTDILYMPVKPGAIPTNLTRTANNDGDPSWSPDSKRVVFWTGAKRNADIAVVALSSPGKITRLTTGPRRDIDPNWSSQDEIAFVRQGRSHDIWKMDSSGQKQQQLTTGPSEDSEPVWTDDNRILFVRAPDPARSSAPYRMWVMNGDGSGLKAILKEGGLWVDVEPAPLPGTSARRSLAAIMSVERTLACWNGTSSGDTKYDYSGVNCLHGWGGADTLHGLGGADHVYGDSGNDKVYGDSGNDTVHGGTGDDRVYGGTGSDYEYGDDGTDSLFAEDVTLDYVNGGNGTDQAYVDDNLDTVVSATSH
jgi:Tol biopolymer transport system component